MTHPDSKIPLAQALSALREDLAARHPPGSVLAVALRAARRAGQPAMRAGPPPADGVRRAGSGAMLGLASWRSWSGAATCAAVLLVSLLLLLRPPQLSPGGQHAAASDAVRAASPVPSLATGGARPADPASTLVPAMHFVPLVSPERLRAVAQAAANGPARRSPEGSAIEAPAWLLTTELPQERLAAMGLPYDPARAAEPLRAELLVTGSGEVLAVRLLF